LIGDYVLASMIVFEVDPDASDELFDFASVTDACTLYLRAGDVALYATFNDAQACVGAIDDILERITGMLSPPQARELAAELAAANLHLTNRPRFQTLMSDSDGADLRIVAQVPTGGPIFEQRDHPTIGFVKHFMLNRVTGNVDGKSREDTAELLLQNKLSFLFDADGVFIKNDRQPDKRPSRGAWSQSLAATDD
jgi:hypothetical protein